ncbi:hypothetical protein QEH59_13615 [Coraliomargarita sp. SDUM461004]|uniref:Uncharacterized protein n=1 Tax=Thalassobacterium sedimentorum TaxID=3041258 RepID=A0ABU1AMN0_9BACT|nr:hypothetical protein [Coraliomargarita sp. SDUM461004]MDQ8195468.1 hypothetical protein [Coraliomargarita sp. SDUM461004]
MMLDNREISLLFWLAVVLAWGCTHRQIREGLINLLASALKPKLVIGFVMMLAYITSCVLFLWLNGVWDSSNLKATIIWSLTAAALMVGKVISNDATPTKFFGSAVWGGLKLSVVLEFVVQLYVFPLVVELFVVPIAALIGAMIAVCETDEKFAPVKRLLNGVLSILGFTMIAYAAYRLPPEFSNFWQWSTVLSFSLPIVLTVLFIPFLWLVAVAVAYENVFCRLQFFMTDSKMQRFVRRQMYWNFGMRFYEVNRWWPIYMQERPQTKEAFKQSMVRARFEKENGNL